MFALQKTSERKMHTHPLLPCGKQMLAARSIFRGVRHITKYTKSHEYIKVDGAVGTVGITNYAQSALGDVVYVGVPDVGAVYKKGCVFGVCV